MSMLIKGMKMPKSCEECRFCDNDAMCVILGEDLFDHVQAEVSAHLRFLPDDWKCDACPLVEIPKHGRLIDADEMELTMNDTVQGNIRGYPYSDTLWDLAFCWIDNQPTIIEADGQ